MSLDLRTLKGDPAAFADLRKQAAKMCRKPIRVTALAEQLGIRVSAVRRILPGALYTRRDEEKGRPLYVQAAKG